MLRYTGGSKVGKGTYWNLRKGLRVDVAAEEVLPGDAAAIYLKMPMAVMLLTGPFIGLVYAVLMPFIGIGTVVVIGVRAALRGMYNLAAKTISFGWRPSDAYLAGKKKKTQEKQDKK